MLQPPAVALVGAGPGHPGLLTLRAVECLRRAELVLYDRLVPAGLLDGAWGDVAYMVAVSAQDGIMQLVARGASPPTGKS